MLKLVEVPLMEIPWYRTCYYSEDVGPGYGWFVIAQPRFAEHWSKYFIAKCKVINERIL